jgi:hypothetical protein
MRVGWIYSLPRGALTFLKHRVLFYVKQMEIGKDTTDSIVWPSPYASIDTCVCMCLLNAITNFINSQMEVIKLQLLVTQYRSLGQKKPYKISKVYC